MEIDSETDVAGRLRALQEHYGLTIQEMADRCSLPKRSLENYMKRTNPQRPGLDALRGIADGMGVSIDWLVGRSPEMSAPEFRSEDYATFCHSVVLRLLSELIPIAASEPGRFDAQLLTIDGRDHADIAARAMLDFMNVVRVQSGNATRPEGYFHRQFDAISKRADRTEKGGSNSVDTARKP
ncbi:helix-turn-helix transcriptional regulator [Primorskyibacter aestuariivivens]|uniref:helix-turn-helix domain-containing protein n=1 Tax=Primorskyibacter aestuariivivens TaxID=1888912 RepID=UPI002300C660|nr:helix-turn-helix transcriptional regulator [Primorskyibacter aestuariivivens]MDA7427907.1 helix-turn-helix transcriptional regulator [Primorskyibacter aestuariivivens]